MQWVTRAYVHLDRVASPWLILRFIDPQAEFVFVQWGEEHRRPAEAIAFALPGAPFGPHDAEGTTFAKLRRGYALTDPALEAIESVVDAGVAHVLHDYRPGPEDRYGQIAVGLLAIAEGMLLARRDDAVILRDSMVFYDALYAQFRAEHRVHAEGHALPGHGDGRGPTARVEFLRALMDRPPAAGGSR
jgi:hypothetical protein